MPGVPMIAPRAKRRSGGGVKVVGIDDVLVRLGGCCNPVPGDEIIGFVTRGRGVSVHRADCPNAKELLSQPERIIDVEWDTGGASTYQVEIVLEALDRTRLLQDVSIVLADTGVNVLSAAVSTDRQGIATMRFLLELGSMDQLTKVLNAVRGVDGVFEARRSMPDAGAARKKSS